MLGAHHQVPTQLRIQPPQLHPQALLSRGFFGPSGEGVGGLEAEAPAKKGLQVEEAGLARGDKRTPFAKRCNATRQAHPVTGGKRGAGREDCIRFGVGFRLVLSQSRGLAFRLVLV